MALRISRLLLKDVATKLKCALATKPLNPVLGHFVFECADKNLTIKATDGMISCVWMGTIEDCDNINFSIDGSLLSALLPTLKDDIIIIENTKDRDYKLICGNYELVFSSGNLKDYPKIDYPINLKEIILPSNFSDMLKLLEPSIGDPKIQTNYKGLCLEIGRKPNLLELIATDNLRLSYAKLTLDFVDQLKIIIPKESVPELIRLTPSSMFYDSLKKKAYFKSVIEGNTILLNTLLHNFAFSNVTSFIDTQFEGQEIKISKADLLSLLKRLKCTTDSDDRDLYLTISNGNLFANTKSFKTKSQESIVLNVLPDLQMTFSLNIMFLLDYLKIEKEDDLVIKVVKDRFLLIDKLNFRQVLSVNA